MKIVLLSIIGILSLFINGCDYHRKVNIPGADASKEIEIKVRELGIKVNNIDEEKILKILGKEDSVYFKQRLRELKINYNRASSLIKDDYQKGDEEKLEVEYFKTKVIWDYIVHKYPI